MSYLLGDSTPSHLTSNFIEFLRESLDFGVHVLLANERMEKCRSRIVVLQGEADREIEKLSELEKIVARVVTEANAGDASSPSGRCAVAVMRGAEDAVNSAQMEVRALLSGEIARLEAQEGTERESCLRALETLLLRHDPPETQSTLRLVQSGETQYTGELLATTPYGLQWSVELEIPSSHVFGQIARLDKILPQLEVQAPETGGWIRKEVKMRPQRLDRYYLVELTTTETTSAFKLRANADGSGPGFDVAVGAEDRRVRFARADETDAATPPFDLTQEDEAKLFSLHEKLLTAAADLGKSRRRLTEARFDGDPFQDSYQPTVAVDRLIAAMAPVVNEIAQHSLSPNELVLKRLMGNDRREEIFVSKAALREKLLPLPIGLRARFIDLNLGSILDASRASVSAAPVARIASTPDDEMESEAPIPLRTPRPEAPQMLEASARNEPSVVLEEARWET